ncbi:uncharacterized protein LOC116691752 isoform X2 [Etheostoma spectabile]|nr:uncharacterized protein LOC116691752 isoform X2 [Etheostoma spectabile]
MTHPTDFSSHLLPKSGQGQHTQESGDAGLSSNMKHKFSDHYNERASPVANEDISGKPTPNEEVDIVTAMKAKIWSPPNHARPKAEANPVSADEESSKPSTSNNFPQHTLSKNSPQEETVTVLPGTTAITEGRPDAEEAGEESCKMDTGKTPKPKGPPLVPRTGRNHRRKRAGTYWKMYVLCWWSFAHVPVSDGVSGAQLAPGHKVRCFNCIDNDSCLVKLMTIYDKDDKILYKRNLNQKFSGCSGISPNGSKSCDVCIHRSKITILCSENVGKLDVEGSDGRIHISVCDQHQTLDQPDGFISNVGAQTPGRARYGLIGTGALVLIAVMLLVYS